MPKGPSYLMILVVMGCVLLIGAGSFTWEHFAPQAYGDDPQRFQHGRDDQLLDAKFAGDRLWLLSRSGKLWSLAEGDAAPLQTPLSGPVSALCAGPNGLAITLDESGPGLWRVQELEDDGWRDLGTVRKNGEGLVGLACDGSGVSLLSVRRMVSFDGERTTTKPLSRRIPVMPDRAIFATPGQIWLALRMGEFGGGLLSIDRRNGEVRDLRRNVSGELCGGPLSPECDPVNAVMPVPWKPDCMVASIGLQHGGPRGRLITVCGDRIERLYFGPCTGPDGRGQPRATDDRCGEALYGMARKGDALMVSGSGGLGLIGSAGLIRPEPAPAFRSYGPFEINFRPDVVIVRTRPSIADIADDPFYSASSLMLVERTPT